jgi:cobalt/nickel transport system permease protein
MTAAYIFGAQMVNFPVAAGTSGHLLGGLLAAVLVGPSAATVVMAAVFVIQTFFFLDGGHTALGANVLNMGLAGTWGGYAVYRALAGPAPGARRSLWAAGAAAWCSVMLGAALTAAQLAASGTVAGGLVFPAMLGVHILIGVGEAALTVAALGLLWRVRPDVVTGAARGPAANSRAWQWAGFGGLAAVAALAPFASSAPDGLERVAETLRFDRAGAAPLLPGLLPDYQLPGFAAPWAPAAVSLFGAGLMVIALGPIRRLSPRHHPATSPPHHLTTPSAPDARVRLACALALVLCAALLPPGQGTRIPLLALVALGWVVLARVSLIWLAGRALLLLPFLGLVALSLPAFRTGGPEAGTAGLTLLRAAASLLATAGFLAGLREAEVVTALAAFRLPTAITTTVTFALRYLRLTAAEAARMLQARAARSGGAGTLALRAGVGGSIIGSLFVRSLERSERVSLAMEARGYRGGTLLPAGKPLTAADLAFGAGFGLFLIGVCLWP